MKKILLVMMVGLVFLSGCTKKEPFEPGKITYLSLEEYEEKIKTDDKFMVVIGNVDCSACKEFKSVLEELNANHSLEVFYVQIDNSKWSDEDKDKLKELTNETYGFVVNATPTLFIVDQKEIKESKVGYLEYGKLLDMLKDNSLIEG